METPPDRSAGDEPIRFKQLLIQFALIPMALAAVCSAIFIGVKWMTGETKGAAQYASELAARDRRDRWMAALELAQRNLKDPKLVGVLAEILATPEEQQETLPWSPVHALKGGSEGRPGIRWFAAQALGRSQDPRAAAPLAKALADADSGVRLNAALALGELGAASAEAVPDLCGLLAADPDEGVRKSAAFSLGRIGDERAVPALRKAVSDGRAQVRWNAALGLAQMKASGGEETHAEMLDRAAVSRVAVPAAAAGEERPINETEIQDVLANGIQAAVRLKDKRLIPPIEKLARDPSPQVGALAKRALQELKGAQ